ncbi:hypothetical protein AWZ03_004726 [Drosophila navojoa]|uniref:CHK kinase-like domain-containing protein n=1 Tax=Drosophila navojoa TaxID=7232 RepID=A0A484BJ44_DRONA|nr:hypothetical protein AWZ03_004726 [Drosophila navojoa]
MSPASAKGDHYASIMFRANVSYTCTGGKQSKSLIIKTMPDEEGHKKEMLSGSHLFETEIGMYTKVLPRFEQILREAGDNTRLCAPCLYCSLEPRQVMIFEDLVPLGYTVIRKREATTEELNFAFLKLAKLHAVSFHVLHEVNTRWKYLKYVHILNATFHFIFILKQPEYLQEFKNGLFEIPNMRQDPFCITGMKKFLDFLEEFPELRKYKPYFEKMENDYIDRVEIVMQEYRRNRKPNGYYVLCHGDFHLKNMMFKQREDGSLEDVMLLDYQVSNICPITMDLIYAVYMLMGIEERHNNYKELLDYYFAEFLATLQNIGYKGDLPNSVEFWQQIFQHKCYDIYLITTFLPMMNAFKHNDFDPAEVFQKEDLQRGMYRLDSYVQDVKYLLARFEAEGFFQNQ